MMMMCQIKLWLLLFFKRGTAAGSNMRYVYDRCMSVVTLLYGIAIPHALYSNPFMIDNHRSSLLIISRSYFPYSLLYSSPFGQEDRVATASVDLDLLIRYV